MPGAGRTEAIVLLDRPVIFCYQALKCDFNLLAEYVHFFCVPACVRACAYMG